MASDDLNDDNDGNQTFTAYHTQKPLKLLWKSKLMSYSYANRENERKCSRDNE